MITLLQNIIIQFRRPFDIITYSNYFVIISYYKVRRKSFITKCDNMLLESTVGITECDRLLIQGASGTTNCGRFYYKVCQVLQNETVITK